MMIISSLFLVIIYGSIHHCRAEEVEEGVVVLTQDTFDGHLTNSHLLMVMFYAPWCEHSKKLAPEFVKMAKTLEESNSPVQLAKVDATAAKSLEFRYGISAVPSIKLFIEGVPIDYKGERNSADMLAWLASKQQNKVVKVDSIEQANDLLLSNKVVIFAILPSAASKSVRAFEIAAASFDKEVFGVISSASIMKSLNVSSASESILLLKKFDEERNVLEGVQSAESIIKFVKEFHHPLVFDFSIATSKIISYSDIPSHFLLFCSAKSDKHKQRLALAKKLAMEMKGHMMFINVDIDSETNKHVLDFFGVSLEDTPTFRIMNVPKDYMKFKPKSSAFTEENFRTFIKEYESGNVESDVKTTEVPDDWDAKPVKVLVGKSFQEVVNDASKDVFVEFYAPWCGHCQKLAPIWEKLGDTFKDVTDVMIAKIDYTINEVPGIKITGFPTIKLFRKHDNKVVDYLAERHLDKLIYFIRPDMLDKTEL